MTTFPSDIYHDKKLAKEAKMVKEGEGCMMTPQWKNGEEVRVEFVGKIWEQKLDYDGKFTTYTVKGRNEGVTLIALVTKECLHEVEK